MHFILVIASREEKDNFYKELGSTISDFNNGIIVILRGNISSKVGSSNAVLEDTLVNHGIEIINNNNE